MRMWMENNFYWNYIVSVQFSSLVMSSCLQPHGLQQARPHCPSLTTGVYSNSCPSSRWCDPTISSSVIPFSSCLQSFLASGSFPMNLTQMWPRDCDPFLCPWPPFPMSGNKTRAEPAVRRLHSKYRDAWNARLPGATWIPAVTLILQGGTIRRVFLPSGSQQAPNG